MAGKVTRTGKVTRSEDKVTRSEDKVTRSEDKVTRTGKVIADTSLEQPIDLKGYIGKQSRTNPPKGRKKPSILHTETSRNNPESKPESE